MSILEKEYASVALRVRRYLASKYGLQVCPTSSPDYPTEKSWREVWEIYMINGEQHQLLLAVPHTFPDALPAVYLPVAEAARLGQIPHLDSDRLLCTFETNVAFANADSPEEIAEAVLRRAIQVIDDGTSGRNSADYADELVAYWDDGAQGTARAALCLLPTVSTRRSVRVAQLHPDWKGFHFILGETDEETRQFLGAVGYKGKLQSSDGLHIALTDFGLAPYPATNAELHSLLQATAPTTLQRIESFLKSANRPAWVLASVQTPTGHTRIAWSHPPILQQRLTQHGYRTVATEMPGFRPGHIPANLELTTINPRGRLRRVKPIQADRDRLVVRTAGHSITTEVAPVNVLGCGSVGSFIAEGLARSGRYANLKLLDQKVLTIDNVMRHLCGTSEIGQAKTIAIANKLRAHYPHIGIETLEGEVLDVLRTTPDKLSGSALTVIALGNLAVERRINAMIQTGHDPFSSPVCFVWVEPFLYGGHALLIPRRQPGCFECLFDECFRFNHRIVADPGKHVHREPGCQSSFVPYSGNDLIHFVSVALRFLLQGTEDATQPLLLSWTGDLAHAQRHGVAIMPGYENQVPFTSIVRAIDPNPACPFCRYQ